MFQFENFSPYAPTVRLRDQNQIPLSRETRKFQQKIIENSSSAEISATWRRK
jgi:hypothetical protein